MHIAVLVKTVPDSEARMEISDGGRGLRVEEKWELNYFDAIAVEKAVKIKEAFPR
jgi:electron transfer flavoprotein alpha/beta subunit